MKQFIELTFKITIIYYIIGFVSSDYLDSVKNVTRVKFRDLSETEITEPDENGLLWSSILEDWAIGKTSNRIARIIAPTQYVQHQTFSPPSQQQHQQKYGPSPNNFIPAANYYFSNRVDNVETIEYDPNPKPNPTTPTTKAPAKQVQPNLYQNFSPVRQNSHHQNMMPSQREISETDLFLLSAIEKLTYRVDYLEKRLKRTEQLVLYLMEGTPEQEEQYQRPACPGNFTKIGDTCYFVGTDRGLNWKSASAMCKSLGGQLAELETHSKLQEIIYSLLNDFEVRGKDFWVGGLNPGLLWIWINSGKPVNPNANLNNVVPQRKSKILIQQDNPINITESYSINSTMTDTFLLTESSSSSEEQEQSKDLDGEIEEKVLYSRSTTAAPKIVNKPPQNRPNNQPSKQNDPNEIRGSGRCLRLSYNPATHSYGYTGVDCVQRTNYLCELKDKTADNEIRRLAKGLNFN